MPCYVRPNAQPQQEGYWQNGVWYTQQGYWWNGRWYYYTQPRQPYTPLQRPREERIIELPEDGDMWHLTVVVDNSQQSAWVRQEIANAPRLVELTKQVKHHVYTPDYWWVKDNLPGSAVPVVMLSTHTGQLVYKASGNDIPRQPEDLADEVESAIQAYAAKLQRQTINRTAPRRALATTNVADCPDCTPRPTPRPTPNPNNSRPFHNVPDLRPNNTKPDGSGGGVGLGVVALLIIAGLAGWAYTRNNP